MTCMMSLLHSNNDGKLGLPKAMLLAVISVKSISRHQDWMSAVLQGKGCRNSICCCQGACVAFVVEKGA